MRHSIPRTVFVVLIAASYLYLFLFCLDNGFTGYLSEILTNRGEYSASFTQYLEDCYGLRGYHNLMDFVVLAFAVCSVFSAIKVFRSMKGSLSKPIGYGVGIGLAVLTLILIRANEEALGRHRIDWFDMALLCIPLCILLLARRVGRVVEIG